VQPIALAYLGRGFYVKSADATFAMGWKGAGLDRRMQRSGGRCGRGAARCCTLVRRGLASGGGDPRPDQAPRDRAAGRVHAEAQEERLRDGLTVEDILESVVNANAIKKVLRSRAAARRHSRERLYVIESPNFSGTWVYTKGTIRRKGGQEVFYVFVSSKLAG